MPFPTQQILFHDQTEATDGDRAQQREGWPAGKKDVPKTRTIGGMLKQISEMKMSRAKDFGEKQPPHFSKAESQESRDRQSPSQDQS